MIRRNRVLLVLLGIAIIIKIFSLFPEAVESIYSNGMYPVISRIQRFFLGWIPFSIGDLLYAFVIIYLLVHIRKFGLRLFRKNVNKIYLIAAVRKILSLALIIYMWFNISWGLNYNRVGIGRQLEVLPYDYSNHDLLEVMKQLTTKLNTLYSPGLQQRSSLHKKRFLFNNAVDAYANLHKKDHQFLYKVPSVKPSIYSYLGNYLGFTGYYNPFTGEAQVNTTVPVFIRPFTTCHEIGHQLGYAKESEANFAGYLSARSSNNPAFRYSVYFDMYSYARGYLYAADSMMLKKLDSTLAPGVKKDFRDRNEFFSSRANPFEVLIDNLYGEYLRANEQPSGKISYNEVILLLVAYYKKHGEI